MKIRTGILETRELFAREGVFLSRRLKLAQSLGAGRNNWKEQLEGSILKDPLKGRGVDYEKENIVTSVCMYVIGGM